MEAPPSKPWMKKPSDLLDEIAASPPIAEKLKRLRAGEKVAGL